MGVKRDHPQSREHPSDVSYDANGVSRRTTSNGASSHSMLLGCQKDIRTNRNHHHMVDQEVGKGLRLCSDTMGAAISGGSRTRSSTRTKSPINYKELAHGASGKRNRQSQMDSVDKTMQPNNYKVRMGALQENGRKDVWVKNEDKQRNTVQLFSGEDGGAKPLNPTGNYGRGAFWLLKLVYVTVILIL
ncbi:hypothetical protein BVRB_8g181960 [Beta vulgaris subsp. vulgaris]|nr:hypothetical protein BVRB_8g181960 [Beta vulgaris subsp. vulgaris]